MGSNVVVPVREGHQEELHAPDAFPRQIIIVEAPDTLLRARRCQGKEPVLIASTVLSQLRRHGELHMNLVHILSAISRLTSRKKVMGLC